MSLEIQKKFHPASWWILGFAVSVSSIMATNIYWLASLCIFSITLIYLGTKTQTRAGGFVLSLNFYLLLAIVVVATRLLFRLLFGSTAEGGTILLDLPRLQLNLGFGLPIEFLGPASVSSISEGLEDGLKLASIILGIGLATVLANPRRLLKSVPAALFEIATSISIAINLAPQLIKSIQRVHKARQLRGRSTGVGALAGHIIPVLEDAIHSSLALAASMDSRGFGAIKDNKSPLLNAAVSITSISLMAIGSYLLVTRGIENFYLIALSLVFGCASLWLGSKSGRRTRLMKNTFSWWDTAPLLMAASLLAVAVLSGWLP